MKKIGGLLFVFFYTYAIVRYHYGKEIPMSDWLYVLNKAFAWTGFTLVGLSILPVRYLEKWLLMRKNLGLLGYALCFLHVICNFFVLDQAHFPFLYEAIQDWNLKAWLSLFFAALSMTLFTGALISSLKLFTLSVVWQKHLLHAGKYGFFFAILHPLAMSYDRWSVKGWPLNLPPISLLAVVTGVGLFFLRYCLKGNN